MLHWHARGDKPLLVQLGAIPAEFLDDVLLGVQLLPGIICSLL